MARMLAGVSDGAITLGGILETRGRLGGRVHRTPLLSSATAARVAGSATGVRLRDERVYLKAEHLQKTGSFKPRGVLTKIAALTAEERERGLITISAGNHAQALAYAARAAGARCTVVMPEGAPATKIANTRSYGATVILHPDRVTLLDRCRQ